MIKKIPHKAAGFCSKECSAAFKAPKIEIPETIEVLTNEVKTKSKTKTKMKTKVKQIEETNLEIGAIEADNTVEVEEQKEYTSSYYNI
jgi:hypothetical protein